MITRRLFVAGLFLLLEHYLQDVSMVVIDDEYTGQGKDIADKLMGFVRKVNPEFARDQIEFRRITKKSNAHKIAWEVHRKLIKTNRIIKARDFLRIV